MTIRGFKIKIKDKRLIEENNLRPDAMYTVSGQDAQSYYISLDNGLEVEVPFEKAEEIPTRTVMQG